MKKSIKRSTIISLVISLACMITDYITAYIWEFPILAIKTGGGECSIYSGFGMTYEKYYPLLADGEEYAGRGYSFGFSLISFLAYWLVIFIIVLMIQRLIRAVKAKSYGEKAG